MQDKIITKSLIFLVGLLMTTSCSHARQFEQDSTNSAFRYREIYLPEGIGKGADELGLNSLDLDWGLWGHNLGKVLPEDPSDSVFARVNGDISKKQFCFSSIQLFDYISDFIIDNYGYEGKTRFSIIPNDNDIVCLCEECVLAGNTEGYAAPSVYALVNKLAAKFPNHIFYTSDYRTVSGPPENVMPANTGVLVSAISYPHTYQSTSAEEKFMGILSAWKEKTGRIMVWDYINNFDDYFTPYPILGVMQGRLKNYKKNNVTGIFLNGSGEDASSFSKLKSIVLAELTANPDADWRQILKDHSLKLYPSTGQLIADFIIDQEEYLMNNGRTLPLYEGVPVAVNTYLPEERFMEFYEEITKKMSQASQDEKNDLKILLAELALTRLELNRIHGSIGESEKLLKDLENLQKEGIKYYSESGWSLENYIDDYRFILKDYKDTNKKKLVKNISLEALTPLDEDYSDITILTDGLLGIPSNYHNGHLITSPESATKIEIKIPELSAPATLEVWLSYNPGFKINLPEKIIIESAELGEIIKEPVYPVKPTGHVALRYDLPAGISSPLMLTIQKDPGTRSMAIEEIRLIEN